MNGRPNDERGFVHKRLLGAVGGFIGGGPAGAISGFLGGGGRGKIRAPQPFPPFPGFPGFPPQGIAPTRTCAEGFRPASGGRCVNITTQWLTGPAGQLFERARHALHGHLGGHPAVPEGGGGPPGLRINGANGLRCDPPLVPNDRGTFCKLPGSPEGGQGEIVKGIYGVGLEPTFETINTRNCLKGYVLGDDAICYKKPLASNKRMWPPGRRPLMTGGDLNAIAKANRAAKKLQAQKKRLESMGMLKKAAPRPRAHQHAREARGVVNV